MEGLQLITTTVIAVLGSFATLGYFVSWQISPLRKDVEHLKAGQARFDSELKEIKAGQANLERKLDQLLAKS